MTTGVTGTTTACTEYRDYEQGYEQGYVGQHVGLSGAHDDDAAPDPGSPAYDPWWRHECDDDEEGETAESHVA